MLFFIKKLENFDNQQSRDIFRREFVFWQDSNHFWQNCDLLLKIHSITLQSIRNKRVNTTPPRNYSIILFYASFSFEKTSLLTMYLSKMVNIGIIIILCSFLSIHAQTSSDLSSLTYEELDSLTTSFSSTNAYEKALTYATQSVKKAKKEFGTEHATYIEYINKLALLHQSYGNYEKAEPYYWEVKDILEKNWGKKNTQYIATLSSLATLQDYMGKYKKAESLHQQVLALEATVSGKKSINYLVYLNSLAFSYYYANKQPYAIPIFTKVSQLCKEILGEQHAYYPTSLVNLASAYKINKNYAQAEQLFIKALSLEQKILSKTDPSYAISLNNVASLYHDMEAYEKAEQLYLEAIDILEQQSMTQSLNYINYSNNIAELYIDLNNFEKAAYYLQQSLWLNLSHHKDVPPDFIQSPKQVLLHSFKFEQKVIPTLRLIYHLSKKQYKQNQQIHFLEQAYNALHTAMKLSHKIRNSFMDTQDKLNNLKQMSPLVSEAIETSTLLTQLKNKEYLSEAFYFAEQNKSMLLLDALKGNRARAFGDLPDSLALLELDLQQKKSVLRKNKFEAQSSDIRAQVIEEENELNKKINQFLTAIKDKYPKYHALKYQNSTISITDLQASLDEESLLLQYFMADSMSYLFVLSPTNLELFNIPIPKDSIKRQIERLRNALSNYDYITNFPQKNQLEYTSTAFWFYNHLLKAPLSKYKAENLVVIADGELGHLPFGVFLTAKASQNVVNYNTLPYLLRKYNISYDYSASLWMKNSRQLSPQNNHQILAFAPTYNQLTDSTTIVTRSAYAHSIRSNLAPLPAAQDEITALEQIIEGRFLRDTLAHEAAFKTFASDYGILHLAMHGVLNNRLSMLSSLVFSETLDSLEDDLLQAYEIAHLNINADLVVLSACETGYGKYEQGEGIMSLARSFMYAGSSSLVVSLWQVNDEATHMIITNFYKNLIKGMCKDEALRVAKLDFVNNVTDVSAHPAFWSAFIQIGNRKNIPAIQKYSFLQWFFIGSGAILLTIGILLAFKTFPKPTFRG